MNRPPINQAVVRVRAVGKLPLLFGLFIPPLIWSIHELVSVILVSSACAGHGGFDSFTIFGYPGWEWILLLLTLLFLVIDAGAGVVAFHSWHRTMAGTDLSGEVGGAPGRSGWMAAAGVLFSCFFFIGILMAGLAVFWLSGCA